MVNLKLSLLENIQDTGNITKHHFQFHFDHTHTKKKNENFDPKSLWKKKHCVRGGGQQFCRHIIKRLDVQQRNDHLCNVILEIGSYEDQGRLIAHRIVLCAASPLFYSALLNEKEEGVIRLEDTSKVLMEQVLDFFYMTCIKVTTSERVRI